MTISVIIPTFNRDDKIILCLESLFNQKTKPTEIIILDQNIEKLPLLTKYINSHPCNIRYLKSSTRNKSTSINKIVNTATGDILAFTDDDCIITPNWISEIYTVFTINPKISCITGNTYPYRNILKKSCQPTISTKKYIFTKPIYHTFIGFGNNFAIRKSVFKSVGLFKNWLGPGSIGLAAEDGELFIRLLKHNYKILHDPNIVIYHNKNSNTNDLKQQNLRYTCGEMACYGYYAFQKYKFAKIIVQNNIKDSIYKIRKIIKKIIYPNLNISLKYNHVYVFTELLYRLRGLMIGYFFALKTHIS
jgi:GT2 family glycosyltransferase